MDIERLKSNGNLEIRQNVIGSKLSAFGSGGDIRTVVFPEARLRRYGLSRL
jgi:hypothetical protein